MDKLGLPGADSAEQLIPKLTEAERSVDTKITADVANSSLLHTSQSSKEAVMFQQQSVIADNDDEFDHVMSEPPVTSVSADSQSNAVKPTAFANSFLDFLQSKSPVKRPPLPKFVVQIRPQLRLQMPRAANTVPPVRPVAISKPNIVSPPKQQTITVIRNSSSEKVADQEAPATKVPQKEKNLVAEKVAHQEPPATKVPPKEKNLVEKVTPVISNRQPRVSKRMLLS